MDKIFGFFEKVDKVFGLEEKIREEVVSAVANLNTNDVTPEDIEEQQEQVANRQSTAEYIGERVPILNGCKTWKDIGKVAVKKGWEAQKEVFFIQVFAGGILLVGLDNVSLAGRLILGPAMIKIGYQKSQLLQRYTPEKLAKMFPEADYEKVKTI